MIRVEYRKGVYLPELDLWLDPHGVKERAFVSHAHFDHFARHQEVITSSVNADLMSARFGMAKKRIQAYPYQKAWEEGGFRYELLPAGHIFGSCMLHLTRLSDEATLLYTGDFKMRQGLSAEAVLLKRADILITETTFGLPKYIFPPEREIQEQILRFVKEAFEDEVVPVLYGYSLGKAQEVIALLEREQIKVMQHKTVARMTRASRSAGLEIGDPVVFEKEVPLETAVICPPNTVRSQAIRQMKNKRSAMLSGWAMNANAHYRYQTDTSFPLSDHADYDGLLEAVKKVRPKLVLTLHGYAKEFASDLRSRGIEAWSVLGNDQMEFNLLSSGENHVLETRERPECELQIFSDLCGNVERVLARSEKVELLSAYLCTLPLGELRLATTWLAGRVFSRTHKHRDAGVGVAMVRQSVLRASGLPLARYKEVSATQNEISRTVRILLEESPITSAQTYSLSSLHTQFVNLAEMSGSLEKVNLIADTLATLHPREAEIVSRVLTGGMRIGAKEGLLEEGIARAFCVEISLVRRAHLLSGDLGEVAQRAKLGSLESISVYPFFPVKVMLASPEADAQGVYDRLGSQGRKVWLEQKYDGIRAQLHKKGAEVSLYSRDLRSLDKEFPELLASVSEVSGDFILDGELIAYAEGRKLNFFDLQKRLGKSKEQGDLFLGEAVPVKYIAFDLLYLDGEDYLKSPLSERRKALEGVSLSSFCEVITVKNVESVKEIEDVFNSAKKEGNEGLVAKDAQSLYELGRRGRSWLKLKKPMPTLDCVVIRAQQGHGRRAEVLSDYTFAIRDQRDGSLKVIGKAYSGLTDREIEELTEHFREYTLSKEKRVHTVEPNIVLEIVFDSVRKSKRHDSGLALRFPSIKAVRRDKTKEEIDTLEFAESLI